MSVRAYRVTKMEWEQEPTFNLWQQEYLCDFLEVLHESSGLNNNGTGLVEIPVEKLRQAIKRAKKLMLNKADVACLQRDIDAAKKLGDEYILYTCF